MDLEAATTAKEPVDEGSLEDEEEEEEEEYFESEPILSYLRMKNDIPKILQKDSVSCIKAGLKVKNLDHDSPKVPLLTIVTCPDHRPWNSLGSSLHP